MTTDRLPLADRLRARLSAESSTREVRMFGGVSFMVNDTLIAAVRGDGDLLVRAAAARGRELAALPGARPAEMGSGRPMGPGWTNVAATAVATDEQLSFWIDVALDFITTEMAGLH